MLFYSSSRASRRPVALALLHCFAVFPPTASLVAFGLFFQTNTTPYYRFDRFLRSISFFEMLDESDRVPKVFSIVKDFYRPIFFFSK